MTYLAHPSPHRDANLLEGMLWLEDGTLPPLVFWQLVFRAGAVPSLGREIR